MPAADVPVSFVPKSPVAEIATYGSASMWVDKGRGVLLREGRRTVRVSLPATLRDLDLGPGPDGRAVAVYVRSGKTYMFDLRRKVETSVRGASGAKLPTVWGKTLAFTRSGATYALTLGSSKARRLMRYSGFSDMELGAGGALVFSGEYDDGEANGQTEVDMVSLSKPTADWGNLDFAYIGEGSAAGFGGITADERGFTWMRASRNGCAEVKRQVRRHGANVGSADAPLSARFAQPEIPGTPESENCDS